MPPRYLIATRAAARELPEGEGAPEWVQLLPPGRHVAGRDGRRFDVDHRAIVAAFEANGADLPIDYHHQNEPQVAAGVSGPIPAAGWIVDMRADEGGLWGRVSWT